MFTQASLSLHPSRKLYPVFEYPTQSHDQHVTTYFSRISPSPHPMALSNRGVKLFLGPAILLVNRKPMLLHLGYDQPFQHQRHTIFNSPFDSQGRSNTPPCTLNTSAFPVQSSHNSHNTACLKPHTRQKSSQLPLLRLFATMSGPQLSADGRVQAFLQRLHMPCGTKSLILQSLSSKNALPKLKSIVALVKLSGLGCLAYKFAALWRIAIASARLPNS